MIQLDEVDASLFKQMKITYQSGKGNNHLVPVLIPLDVLAALEVLTEPTVRQQCSIKSDNMYVFPCTKLSDCHVNGWKAVNRVCLDALVDNPELLTATKMRHRVSTIYAGMDVPENQRNYFYKHMGHSAEINASIYQTPLAEAEIRMVGTHLISMDRNINEKRSGVLGCLNNKSNIPEKLANAVISTSCQNVEARPSNSLNACQTSITDGIDKSAAIFTGLFNENEKEASSSALVDQRSTQMRKTGMQQFTLIFISLSICVLRNVMDEC